MLIKQREVPNSSSIWNIWFLQVVPANISHWNQEETKRDLLQVQAKDIFFDALVKPFLGGQIQVRLWTDLEMNEKAPGLQVLTVQWVERYGVKRDMRQTFELNGNTKSS